MVDTDLHPLYAARGLFRTEMKSICMVRRSSRSEVETACPRLSAHPLWRASDGSKLMASERRCEITGGAAEEQPVNATGLWMAHEDKKVGLRPGCGRGLSDRWFIATKARTRPATLTTRCLRQWPAGHMPACSPKACL